MKKQVSWVNSLFGVLWLGTWFWYLAGIASIAVSIEHLKPPANLAVWWFLMKAALPWAICGLFWTGFCALTLRPWFVSGSVTTQDTHVLKKGCYILSGFVATLALAALYRWYLPVLNLPENMILKTGKVCRIISLILTITATIPIVSFVMAYLIKLSLDKREEKQTVGKTKRTQVRIPLVVFIGFAFIAYLVYHGADKKDIKVEKLTKSLHQAVADGDIEQVKLQIARGTDVNAKTETGLTPLHIAAFKGNKDIAELLLAKGADVNVKQKSGETPLHLAVLQGRMNIVELLVRNGADVTAANWEGITPLHFAISEGHKDIANLLRKYGAKDWELPKLMTLHEAAKAGNVEIVKARLNKTSDVDSRNMEGWTPLMAAAFAGHKDVANFLSEMGADVNAHDKFGQTPLHLAAMGGHKDIVELLLAKGAYIDAKGKDGETPLHVAVGKDVVELLIARGANVNAKSIGGLTPLHVAAFAGNKDVVDLLIAKGADVNAEGKEGETSLHEAAGSGHKDVVELLLVKGAEVNTRKKDGETALHEAAGSGHKDVVELLIAKGADINAQDEQYGWTPLHCAAKGFIDESLLEQYLHTNIVPPTGKDYKDIVKLLIEKGANVNIRDNAGRTPLSWAKFKRHEEIAELLRKHGAKE